MTQQLKLSLKAEDFPGFAERIKQEGDEFFINYSEKKRIHFKSHNKDKLISKIRGIKNASQCEIIFSVDTPSSREDIKEFFCYELEVEYIDTLKRAKFIFKEIGNTLDEAESYLKTAYYIFEKNDETLTLSLEGYEEPISNKPYRTMGILRLANIYDKNKDSATLKKFLNIFSHNFSEWDIELKNKIPQELIETDIQLIKEQENNEMLEKLFNQRDKEIAHRDLDYLLHKYSEEEKFIFANKEELFNLIKFARELLGKYKKICD